MADGTRGVRGEVEEEEGEDMVGIDRMMAMVAAVIPARAMVVGALMVVRVCCILYAPFLPPSSLFPP